MNAGTIIALIKGIGKYKGVMSDTGMVTDCFDERYQLNASFFLVLPYCCSD